MITFKLQPNQLERGDNRILLVVQNLSEFTCQGLTIRLRAGRNLFVDSEPLLTFLPIAPGQTVNEEISLSSVRIGPANLVLRCSWSLQNQQFHNDFAFSLEVIETKKEAQPSQAKITADQVPAQSSGQGKPQPASQFQKSVPPRTTFRVQLLQRDLDHMEVRGLIVPGGGQPKTVVKLPFPLVDLTAVLKALDLGEFTKLELKDEYFLSLKKLNLLSGSRLHSNFYQTVGHALYQALLTADLQTEFAIARRAGYAISFQLCFDPDDVMLTQFPWELFHNGNTHLVLLKNGVELIRYILFADPPALLETSLPLRTLLVSPRPNDDLVLPRETEQEAVLAGLAPLIQKKQLFLSKLGNPTWDEMLNCLSNETFDIIHFDGHGSYARLCPACQTAHYPNMMRCANCKTDISDVIAEGYLHFEDDNHRLDRVSTADLRTILINSQTRLMVLTACDTGIVREASVFNGVAPGLIQAGVPAVVGMQGSPPVDSAVKFVKRFYESLALGQPIPEAVNRGRLAIYRDKPISWFMPVVYLRSSDDTNGQLFKI